MLSGMLDQSLNQLANEALREYVAKRTLEVEVDLEATLRELRAYRAGDPKFERAIAAFADAEAAGTHDPADRSVVTQIGATQAKVQDLLNG
jgi:hypothetical protein